MDDEERSLAMGGLNFLQTVKKSACRIGKGDVTHMLVATRIQKSLVIYIYEFSHPQFSKISVDS